MTTIHRRKLSEHFTVLPNQLLCDKRLSFKARGLLVMMLSKPENWRTNASWIEDQATEGREALQGAFKELETFGYLKRVCERDPHTQRVTCMTWHWSDASSPTNGIPDDGFPSDGEPFSTKNRIEKEHTSPELKNSGNDRVELFAFPEGVEKPIIHSNPLAKRGRPPKPADPRHQEAIEMWRDMWNERFNTPYSFHSKDFKHLKEFLRANPSVEVSKMRDALSGIWSLEVQKGAFAPNSIRILNLCDLCLRWNTIIGNIQ